MSVGTLKRVRSTWQLEAQPHVLLRAKRLFAGSLDRLPHVSITDTEENAVDLLWFLARYPLEMSKADRQHLQEQADASVARSHATASLLIHVPAQLKVDLAKPLYPYQRTAVRFWELNPKFLCADDLGVGKTIQAIGGIAGGLNPAVCVVPNHIQRQWAAKFAEFAPWLNVHIAQKATPYELPGYVDGEPLAGRYNKPTNVLILNYEKLAGWAPFICSWAKAVVYDEVHHLARTGSAKASAAILVSGTVPHLLGMSNTPIRNYGGEMFNILTALGCKSHIGSREEFYREWCGKAVGTQTEPLLRDPEAFVSWLASNGLVLRRTAEQLNLDPHTPELILHEVNCDSAPLEDVETSTEELAKIILGEVQAANFDKMRAASELDWRLRQATGIAKAPYCAEIVKMLVASGEKVVVGVWHRACYDILANRLADVGVVSYSGEENNVQKEKAKEAFARDANVLLLSLRSGEGLDGLQYHSRVCVFAELDWTYTVHHQFIGRLARTGQTKRVLAYFLHTEEGSDPIVLERLGVKRDQHERLINPGRERNLVQLDPGHIRALAAKWLQGRKHRAKER